ncbi:MAG: 4-alpha-glucanotransferase, partial [Limisphaerales bacterium]
MKRPAILQLEDGTSRVCTKELPADLPMGYHTLVQPRSTGKMRLIVAPDKCYLPESPDAWGWALQLYALRSKASWGMGDFGDLRDFARWSSDELQCDFILCNPMGAVAPLLPQQASPYFPGSRLFLNPLYLRIEDVPGANHAGVPISRLARSGHALNQRRLIERDKIFHLKMTALEKIWGRFSGDRRFEDFRAGRGQPLKEFATFCALAECFQSGWHAWPNAFR